MSRARVRVLIAKPGLDGHDRGAKVIALGLRDEGMEVIYTGLRQRPEAIVQTALQEGVDVIGLSCLSGAHKVLFPQITEMLQQNGLGNKMVIAGGNIPEEDIQFLKEKGIAEIFEPGTPIKAIAEYIYQHVKDLTVSAKDENK